VKKVSALKGQTPKSRREAFELLQEALGPEGLDRWAKEVMGRGLRPRARRLSPSTSYEAAGYLGQYLWVSPKDKLVVVRMHRANERDYRSTAPSPAEFFDFNSFAEALIASPAPEPN
jgi:CubicO group peptidase (beta-lactamase class C family)